LTLHLQVSAIATQGSTRANHAVARHARLAACPHDVSDGTRRPRFTGKGRYVTVGGDAARRDTPHG